MSTDPKSLAAEIEAVLRDQIVLRWMGPDSFMEGHEEAARIIAARIAALQSRAFEDGARWMRGRAATECVGRTTFGVEEWDAGYDSACERCAEEIQALPLQPEEAQPTPTTEDKGREDA